MSVASKRKQVTGCTHHQREPFVFRVLIPESKTTFTLANLKEQQHNRQEYLECSLSTQAYGCIECKDVLNHPHLYTRCTFVQAAFA